MPASDGPCLPALTGAWRCVLPFANASDLFIRLIEINVAVFGALAVLLTVLLVVVRSYNGGRRRHRERVVAAWRAIFKTAYTGESAPAPLPRIDRNDWVDVLQLFVNFHELREHDRGREDEVFPALDAIAAGGEFASRALRFLTEGDDPERLLGLNVLGHLRDRAALPHAIELSSHDSPEVSRGAAHCALRIEPRYLTGVLELVGNREDWVRSRIEGMLCEVETHALDVAMLRAVTTADEGGIRLLLDYIRFCSSETARAITRGALARSIDPETIAAALRSLAPLAQEEERATAVRFCAADSPIVLISALRILRKCVRLDDYDLLVRLTAHRDYWVRLRAAEVVVELLGDGEQSIAFANAHPDRFGRDAVRQALSEKHALARRIPVTERRGQRSLEKSA